MGYRDIPYSSALTIETQLKKINQMRNFRQARCSAAKIEDIRPDLLIAYTHDMLVFVCPDARMTADVKPCHGNATIYHSRLVIPAIRRHKLRLRLKHLPLPIHGAVSVRPFPISVFPSSPVPFPITNMKSESISASVASASTGTQQKANLAKLPRPA